MEISPVDVHSLFVVIEALYTLQLCVSLCVCRDHLGLRGV